MFEKVVCSVVRKLGVFETSTFIAATCTFIPARQHPLFPKQTTTFNLTFWTGLVLKTCSNSVLIGSQVLNLAQQGSKGKSSFHQKMVIQHNPCFKVIVRGSRNVCSMMKPDFQTISFKWRSVLSLSLSFSISVFLSIVVESWEDSGEDGEEERERRQPISRLGFNLYCASRQNRACLTVNDHGWFLLYQKTSESPCDFSFCPSVSGCLGISPRHSHMPWFVEGAPRQTQAASSRQALWILWLILGVS